MVASALCSETLSRRPAVLLWVAYEGTGFSGYQAQPQCHTVEGHLAEAVFRMNGAPLRIRAASRTDAGVHALCQPVAFDPTREVDAKGWLRGLNEQLPDSIRIQRVEFVEHGFEPRFQAEKKQYRYDISLGPVQNPLIRNHCWHIDQRMARPQQGARSLDEPNHWLDLTSMQASTHVLVGTHDFAAFQASNDPRDNTVRTVSSLRVTPRMVDGRARLRIEVEGDAFLKNMVRVIVGSLVEIGRGKWSEADLRRALESKDRRQAGPTAPARGLSLVDVKLRYDCAKRRPQGDP